MPPPLSKMSHKHRLLHIAALQKQFGTGRRRKSPVPMPDLSVEHNVSALSNTFEKIKYGSHKRALPSGAEVFPVANNHKQGYELVTPGTIAAGHLKHMNGKKT